jgi:prepilin-type N-terminal cleavage/methylation domain-containing protein
VDKKTLFINFKKSKIIIMRNNKGFTLIEMITVLGVTALLSGLLLVYSRQGENFSLVLRTRTKVISDINRAKNLAIATKDWDGQQTCGYGVYFDVNNNRYIIFTDTSYDCEGSNHLRVANNDVEIIPLPDKFEYLSSNINQVFFLPPDPTIYFDGELAAGEQAEISFRLKEEYKGQGQETLGFKIFINSIGQVWGE